VKEERRRGDGVSQKKVENWWEKVEGRKERGM
jgi:hypothetical protein